MTMIRFLNTTFVFFTSSRIARDEPNIPLNVDK